MGKKLEAAGALALGFIGAGIMAGQGFQLTVVPAIFFGLAIIVAAHIVVGPKSAGIAAVVIAAVLFTAWTLGAFQALSVTIHSVALIEQNENGVPMVPQAMLVIDIVNRGEPTTIRGFQAQLKRPDGWVSDGIQMVLPKTFLKKPINQFEGIDEKAACGPIPTNGNLIGRLMIEWHALRLPHLFFNEPNIDLEVTVTDVRDRTATATVPFRTTNLQMEFAGGDDETMLTNCSSPRR